MRKCAVMAVLLWMVALPARASHLPDYITAQIPKAAPVGAGRMTYMMWDLYDVVLYAPQAHWQQGRPLALSLTYLRDLNGRQIADKSTEEIRAEGFRDEIVLAEWHDQMSSFFPDVQKGTNLTGLLDAKGQSIFYLDGREVGRISDPKFGSLFFGIWLNQNTSDPELRAELLGLQTEKE